MIAHIVLISDHLRYCESLVDVAVDVTTYDTNSNQS